ncbi:MAG: hypothetical protein ACXVJT_13625 [Thermoanaerobaculia bacterium]
MPEPSLNGSATAKPGGSRFTFGCTILFALFALGGLIALVQGIRQYPTKHDAAIAPIVVGRVFTFMGLLLTVGTWYGAKTNATTDALKLQHPDKPWMWREDWASGVIKDINKGRAIALWVFVVVWNAFSFPVALRMRPQMRTDDLPSYAILLFPLIGVILLITAVYQTLRLMKFGTSTCRLERVPIAPGGTFRGNIELNIDAAPEKDYRLRLASIRAVTTGRGKNRSTREKVLWEHELVVSSSAAMRGPSGTRIPFQFAIPRDAQVTDDSNSLDRYLWRMFASAEFPGVDYSAQFEIPVYRTGE